MRDTPQHAAALIRAIYDGKTRILPKSKEDAVLDSPEPCRAIAYHLGYEDLDGTPWWDEVMDIVADA